ncbi:hypothetical protein RHSIM_Rhsim13G0161600 [Rhododendron simsii]|uniref:Gnk2-homologous domain-containing protein n=1 Tax=Rhododendron simsii TaxID=118357 RepID=A0A834L708_RHOSS|nr:hypothetical protein RHSIM_Rhsim13G0161600 [Rhododendron simsii]
MANLPHKMPRKALFVHSICLLSLISIIEGADPTFSYVNCPNTTITRAPENLLANINILPSLFSPDSKVSDGFYKFTIGGSLPDVAFNSSNSTVSNGLIASGNSTVPNAIYGLALCRGDLSDGMCQDCVVYAARDVVQHCPGSIRVAIWYDECMLRYSNAPISPAQERREWVILTDALNVTNVTRFSEVLGEISYFFLSSILLIKYWLFRDCSGYMSPEYAIHGQFSTLFDVFSFGVLILEIITGMKNNGLCQSDIAPDLLSYAWKCWNGGAPLHLMDPMQKDPYSKDEVIKCIHIALLCVQDDPCARPSMATVVAMLDGYFATLSLPQQPAFHGWSRTAYRGFRVVSLYWLHKGCESLSPTFKATPTYSAILCPNITTYSPNSTYKTNLNALFSFLSSNSTVSNGFYNFTAGSGNPDVAYGLFLCRGDVSAAVCRDCVDYAAGDVVKLCPRSKWATIWYDECMLRYSDTSIISTMDITLSVMLPGGENVTEQSGRFNESLREFMGELATRDSLKTQLGDKKFATGEVKLTANQTLYGLLQCTPDITSADCGRCITVAVSNLPYCCYGKQGGRVLYTSCNSLLLLSDFIERTHGVDCSGYISPEYAMHGQFSVKSDVFSFGVVLLEIISGKKTSSFYNPDYVENLLSYAWKLWKDGTPLDLMDPALEGSYSRNEVNRCIHIGLLCAQPNPDTRPSMAKVVRMLNSYSTMSLPQQPAFFAQSRTTSSTLQGLEPDRPIDKPMTLPVNEESIAELDHRYHEKLRPI